MRVTKTAALKVRISRSLKSAVKKLSDQDQVSESDLAREALLEYLLRRGINVQAIAPTWRPPATLTSREEKLVGSLEAAAQTPPETTARRKQPA